MCYYSLFTLVLTYAFANNMDNKALMNKCMWIVYVLHLDGFDWFYSLRITKLLLTGHKSRLSILVTFLQTKTLVNDLVMQLY